MQEVKTQSIFAPVVKGVTIRLIIALAMLTLLGMYMRVPLMVMRWSRGGAINYRSCVYGLRSSTR